MFTTGWLAVAAGLAFGLLIGSFLNVVIARLPRMLERQWKRECAELAGSAPDAASDPTFNLATPRSQCPHCGHMIRWHENVPVISFAVLGGRCSACRKPISWRYPAVEIATGILFGWCAWRWGLSLTALTWAGFSAALVALTLIDWDTTLLPDEKFSVFQRMYVVVPKVVETRTLTCDADALAGTLARQFQAANMHMSIESARAIVDRSLKEVIANGK